MRTVLMALALANVLFFAWAHWISAPASAPLVSASAEPSLPTLPLAQVPPPGAAPAELRCRSLGPFDTATVALAVAEVLRMQGIDPHERSIESQVPDGYVVSIDGLQGTTVQRRALSRLESAGIHDAVAVIQADGTGRISVGVFPDQQLAVRRADQVQLLGYKPVLDLRHRIVAQHWLDMDLPAAEPLPALASFGEAAKGAAFADCPSSASATGGRS